MRVGILGGGPAGAVCALELRRGVLPDGTRPEVRLFDGKSFVQAGPRGCNMCAGVINDAILTRLADLGAELPDALIQRRITGHYYETRAGGVHLPGEPGATVCTVFRNAGPRTDTPSVDQSFDALLLRTALAQGVVHVHAFVSRVEMPAGPAAPFRLHTAAGEAHEVDVLVGAFGVNSALTEAFTRLGFGYRPPRTCHVSQAELPVDPAFLETAFGNEIKLFSLGLPRIHFGVLTPKRAHITVTVIGRDLSRDDLEGFLRHPRVRRHLPPGWTLPPLYCHCHPRIVLGEARHAAADRLLLIGDAHIARYLKGGIASAFFTGAQAARAILESDLSCAALQARYVRPCHARYRWDNLYGRVLFGLSDLISGSPVLARAGWWLLRREQDRPRWLDRHHTQLLWHIFTGDAPYRAIVRQALRPASVLSALLAVALSAAGRLGRDESDDD